MKLFIIAAIVATGIKSVTAHGYLASILYNGISYPGWAPFTDPYLNPVPVRVERRITDNGPVTDVTSPDLTCNKGGNVPTTAFINITAGSQVKFQWDQWTAYVHSGPVFTYMAKCPNGCESFKGDTGTPWFKIDQWGWDKMVTPSWGSDRLAVQNASWTVTIPKTISNGEYLLICSTSSTYCRCKLNFSNDYRHEILALHAAGTLGGAQFYPHCVQIKITGGGSANPSGLAIPGVYVATDPGILTQLWWYSASNTTANYPIPGGPVWQG